MRQALPGNRRVDPAVHILQSIRALTDPPHDGFRQLQDSKNLDNLRALATDVVPETSFKRVARRLWPAPFSH